MMEIGLSQKIIDDVRRDSLVDLVLWWQDCESTYTWLYQLWYNDAWKIPTDELNCLALVALEAENAVMKWKP